MEAFDYLKKLEERGYKAYIVGGYVRDYLLSKSTTDIDITTNATPKEVCEVFGIKKADEIGCINIKNSHLNVDITTFRRESSYDGHLPKNITYTDRLEEDIIRRDFTINTLCMDSNGEIIDLLDGKKDIENKIIRVVGNVKQKFTEDPLRMLRALRFSIIFNFDLGEEEFLFIMNNKELLNKVSYYRKKEEIGKILVSENCKKGLQFLKTIGILDVLEISYDNLVFVNDYIGEWAQLKFSPNYTFSSNEMSRLNNIREMIKLEDIDKYTIFKYGIYDSLIAASILGIDRDKINNIYNQMPILNTHDLKVNGKKIKNLLSLDASPRIKEIKNDLIMKILDGELENDESELVNYIIQKWK